MTIALYHLPGVGVYHLERSPKLGGVLSPWAIKKVEKRFAKTDLASRVIREAIILRSIDHPNVIGFRGFSRTPDGREVLAMEECTTSLGDLLLDFSEKGLGPLSAKNTNFVIQNVCRGLDYLHNVRRLIHGDIKSMNVLIKGNFQCVKLCDFGVCLEMDEKGEAPIEDYIGTALWSAPEVLEDGPVTLKSDIFSFGLVIWEMFALTPPHMLNCDSESQVSDDSMLSNMSNNESMECLHGTRPSLEGIELTKDHDLALKIFNWCTEADLNMRPTAKQILELFPDGPELQN